jgi:hypothetical protein
MRSLVLSVLFTLMGSQLALAGGVMILDPVSVPTLGEWGMIAMAGVLGIVGYLVIRRRAVA